MSDTTMVTSTPARRQPHLPVQTRAILKRLEDDWRQMILRQPVGAKGLDPIALHDALPHAFLLQRTAPGAIRVRVAGHQLHDLLRMDPRGMSVGAFFTEASCQTVLNIIESAFDGPAVVGLPLSAERGIGRKPLHAELLLLPMQDHQQEVTRIMGALVVAGEIGPRGHRFDIANQAVLRYDDLRGQLPEKRGAASRSRPGPRLVVDNG